MAERPELVLNKARMGELGLEAWQRPDGAPRAKLGVVVCAGNPGIQFGSSHAKAPLIAAIVQALVDRRVPVVSFDYVGVGMSAPGGANSDPKSWRIPQGLEAQNSMFQVVELAKAHLADNIVVCGYSYGSAHALKAALAGAHAYVSVSIGYNVFMYMMDEQEKQIIKAEMEDQSKLTCKVLYIVGSKDRMTPMNQVERLVKARPDGGKGAEIAIIKDGAHDLKGREAEAAGLCRDFVMGLQEELEPPPAPAPAAPVAPAQEELEEVRVTALSFEKASLHDSFHLELPKGATVGLLRMILGDGLPSGAGIYEFEGMGARTLKDDEPVPAWVTVEKYNRPITMDVLLTKGQACEAQAMIKKAINTPTMQKKFDELQKESGNVEGKYRLLLTKLMNSEVYPEIVEYFSLPDGPKGVQLLLGAVPTRCDLAMLETWLELETLMRNKAMIARAQGVIETHKYQASLGA